MSQCRSQPRGVASARRQICCPAMPMGSPGMEVPGQAPDSDDVLAFDARGGHSVFMRFRGGSPV